MRVLGTMVLGILLAGLPDRGGRVQAAEAPIPAVQVESPDSSLDAAAYPIDSLTPVSGTTPAKAASPVFLAAPLDSSGKVPGTFKSRSDTVLVVKHSFNHRQQIITGSVIMSCLMLMMVTMNNYNPR